MQAGTAVLLVVMPVVVMATAIPLPETAELSRWEGFLAYLSATLRNTQHLHSVHLVCGSSCVSTAALHRYESSDVKLEVPGRTHDPWL